MERVFELKLEKNRMAASLDLCHPEKRPSILMDGLADLLKENQIIHGVKMDVLELIVNEPDSVVYPIVIAEGTASVKGTDAYLRNEMKEKNNAVSGKFNFREVMHIPSVTKGQLLATEIPPGMGMNGMDVTGRTIMAQNGRPLKIKAGQNVLNQSGQFYSMLDGQVSITHHSISVNPLFEVKGDLDLKTGNLDFIGNIVINGNVPSGYEVKAGGDIRVNGLVEAANLQAAGNIIVQGGIAGAMRGSITAGGNVQVNYLNQAIVKAGNDVYVKSSILHSKVTAGGNVECKTGTIIGGTVSAGRNILVKDLGNELFTKTELAVGWDPMLEKKENETKDSIETAKANIKKLYEIESRLSQIAKQTGKLTDEQQQMIHKQRATIQTMEKQLKDLNDELVLMQAEKQDRLNSSLFVFEKVFPNTKTYFGKYAHMTNQIYKKVTFSLENSEIRIHPLQDPEKVHH